jgi:hypothetical protein
MSRYAVEHVGDVVTLNCAQGAVLADAIFAA